MNIKTRIKELTVEVASKLHCPISVAQDKVSFIDKENRRLFWDEIAKDLAQKSFGNFVTITHDSENDALIVDSPAHMNYDIPAVKWKKFASEIESALQELYSTERVIGIIISIDTGLFPSTPEYLPIGYDIIDTHRI